MKVLFWNTKNNPHINDLLCEIIADNAISLAVVAEYSDKIDDLLQKTSAMGISMCQYPTIGCDRIIIFGRRLDITPGRQTEYASFQILNGKDIICCVHLSSQLFANSSGMREVEINRIVADIQSTENELNTDNTIVVGDFNMNPFDHEFIDANKLHSIPYYEAATKKMRKIAGQEFKMFYNPMWSFFGDSTAPFGTYYYTGNTIDNIYWNIFDQVIIRPVLRERFIDSGLRILTETQTCYLLDSKGHPNKNISDHLPIMFEIKEKDNGKEN